MIRARDSGILCVRFCPFGFSILGFVRFLLITKADAALLFMKKNKVTE